MEKLLVNESRLIEDFKKIGIKEGDTILVHSSLKSIGYVEGGANTVISALLKSVGKNGTIMVPTLTGSEKLSKDNPPVFDVKNSKCWTGTIPETLRQMKEAKRSLHPTHSVAVIGKKANYLIRKHLNSKTPCDKKSPYYRLVKLKGKVLLLGVTLDCMTLIHTLEEVVKVPYHIQPDEVLATIITENGKTIYKKLYIHKYGTPRYFRKIEKELLDKKIMVEGKIGQATSFLIDAKNFYQLALEKLKNNINYFIEP